MNGVEEARHVAPDRLEGLAALAQRREELLIGNGRGQLGHLR